MLHRSQTGTRLTVFALATLLVLAPAILSACTASFPHRPSDGQNFYTAVPSVLSGEDIGLRLVNRTDMSVYYNLCESDLQRRSDGRWASVNLDRTCSDVQFRLAPTETAAYDLATPRSLEAGTYRVVTTISMEREQTKTVRTPSFRIQRTASQASGSQAGP